MPPSATSATRNSSPSADVASADELLLASTDLSPEPASALLDPAVNTLAGTVEPAPSARPVSYQSTRGWGDVISALQAIQRRKSGQSL
jgi:hypothetical protein